ncbi:hypothetical protein PSAC2689_130144 [Paraburkholderia sacchari]
MHGAQKSSRGHACGPGLALHWLAGGYGGLLCAPALTAMRRHATDPVQWLDHTRGQHQCA